MPLRENGSAAVAAAATEAGSSAGLPGPEEEGKRVSAMFVLGCAGGEEESIFVAANSSRTSVGR
jgi:hypothetical protein